ncbi:hypothetical protein DH2020_039162 [Rehmannia glutinosa]|uniref:CID domain-containing protein n=1 Tax=Rehmannia glutinosa TaxID=99300 RepID=A0ABR0UWK7_REHGL
MHFGASWSSTSYVTDVECGFLRGRKPCCQLWRCCYYYSSSFYSLFSLDHACHVKHEGTDNLRAVLSIWTLSFSVQCPTKELKVVKSVESLSRWCISHRKKAKQVVETWEKLFKSAQPQQQVAFLYLSNDILQNSRRKGSDFVNEFWKVLPTTLKGVYDGGNENCRKVASRLDDDMDCALSIISVAMYKPCSLIPFVSRSDLFTPLCSCLGYPVPPVVFFWHASASITTGGQNLKNEMMGKDPSPVNVVKNSNPIKVVKRDDTSLRIKLAVGGLPEKILTAMHLVHDEVVNEEAALNKCRDAVSCVQEIEKDVVNASSQENLQGSDVLDNIQKQENMIQQCISELENAEAIRVALVSQLREALQDQESKLEEIRSCSGQIEQAANMKLQLTTISSVSPTVNQQMLEPTFPPSMPTSNMTVPPPTHPLTSFANSTEEESKKATAAAVAAKLAASTSSAQMLTSILSSLVAEEAASMSSGLKRPKLEPPMQFSDAKTLIIQPFFLAHTRCSLVCHLAQHNRFPS